MRTKPNRREVLIGAASVGAAAALPTPAGSGLLDQKPPMAVVDADDLSIYVRGCGDACDCCWYLRAECKWDGRSVRKLGDKFLIYDRDYQVIGEADPGFKPLPDDAEWCTKVEYARAHDLPHPYDWPREKHAEWDRLHGVGGPQA
jgi:hypothetical protein